MPAPYCLAMVLCDNVHRDPATGKFTILGTFSTLASKEYPANVQVVVYFAVTDGQGPTELCLRLVDARSHIEDVHEPVVEVSSVVDCPDPLAVIEGTFGMRLQIPEAGLYHCELLAGDELLMSRRLLAISPPYRGDEDV